MIYVETGENGRPVRWSSSFFDGAVHTAPNGTDMSMVYFKGDSMLPLPPKNEYFDIWDIETESWVPDVAMAAMESRAERNRRLADSDWTQVADAPVDREAWAAYRQSLRDVTGQDGFPLNIIWPTPPNS